MKVLINVRLKSTAEYQIGWTTVGKDVQICTAWYPALPTQPAPEKINADVLLVLVPGFGSSHKSWYISQASELALKEYGWRSVVYNKPGYGQAGLKNDGEERFYLHRHEFFEEFVRKVKADSGARQVVLMGHSQGGMMSYMAAGKLHNVFEAVVSVAPVWDAFSTYSKVDGTYFHKNWRLDACKAEAARWIKLSPEAWEKVGINMDLVNSLTSNREYDEKVVCKSAGLSSLGEYYSRITDLSKLLEIRCPTLIISSASDTVVDNDTLAADVTRNISRNPNVIWAHFNDGGHIEFPVIRSAEKGIECWANIAGLKFCQACRIVRFQILDNFRSMWELISCANGVREFYSV